MFFFSSKKNQKNRRFESLRREVVLRMKFYMPQKFGCDLLCQLEIEQLYYPLFNR